MSLRNFEEHSDEKFRNKTALEETQEKVLFQCTLCKYKANQQGHLKNHVKSVIKNLLIEAT